VDRHAVLNGAAGADQDYPVVEYVQWRQDGDADDRARVDVLVEFDADGRAGKLAVEHGQAVHVNGHPVPDEILEGRAPHDVRRAVVIAHHVDREVGHVVDLVTDDRDLERGGDWK